MMAEFFGKSQDDYFFKSNLIEKSKWPVNIFVKKIRGYQTMIYTTRYRD